MDGLGWGRVGVVGHNNLSSDTNLTNDVVFLLRLHHFVLD